MNLGLVEQIADAVLYEGYILYPYRPSSVKNQQRFNFGALYPETYSAAGGGTDACMMQTECLVSGTERTVLDVKVRFLHLLAREVGVPIADSGIRSAENGDAETQPALSASHFRRVESLETGDRVFQAWQEACERDVSLSGIKLSELASQPEPQQVRFAFPSREDIEPLREPDGRIVGALVRKQQAIEGAVELRIVDCRLPVDETQRPFSEIGEPQRAHVFKVTVRILNLTPLENAGAKSRDEALMRAFASTHTILSLPGEGEFVSLLDPPEAFREAVSSCRNTGTWPVLAGREGERNVMLSSPIILYDYPQIAPESAGDLFDGTEIDEILTLRIMTLTDEEKREMRGADERARQILERTETLPVEQLMKLHGAVKKAKVRG
ncbi:MAG TPA: hypothetical protein VGX92_16275 [Pyrinomonadaceae bacterium]|jgi:hydrogenase maturation protease|nr:hypothetical protein [Pyrinomonadaceae bacterium]